MKDEWIIEVDESDNFAGKVERKTAHSEDDLRLHREVMVLLYADDKKSSFLLQKRSMHKKQLAGLWTLSATGHVDFADISQQDTEGYLVAATREVREEIGVTASTLYLRGKLIQKNKNNWAVMGIVEGEYIGEIKLDPEEVSEVKIFTKENISIVSDKLTPGAKMCLEFLEILN